MAALCMFSLCSIYSCKKDKTDDYKTFNGTLQLVGGKSLIAAGETLDFHPKGITPPDDIEYLYKWTVTDAEKADTTYTAEEVFSYTFPDACKTYTVSCTLSASGYYGSSATYYCTVVKAGADGSVPEIYSVKTDGSIEIGGIEYGYVQIGKLLWTVRNIGAAKDGISYRGTPLVDELFGKYYNYEQALSACPTGWRLPSDSDWMSAAQSLTDKTLKEHETWEGVSAGLMIDASFNGKRMWEYWPSVGELSNSSRLSVISAGFGNVDSGDVASFYKCAAFWTSDHADESSAYVRYIYEDKPDMYCHKADRASFGASVRCVRNINN